MRVQVGRHRGVERVEELAELDAAVAPMELSDNDARLRIQGRDSDVVPCRV
jgi:hypothetical protein